MKKYLHGKNKRGFTLIEVLIVVAIVGILASVVLVGLGPVQRRGRDARRISDLRQVQTGLELYYAKNGTYPSAVDWAGLKSALIGGSIGVSNVPNDPSSGKEYKYATNGTTYVLGAILEDTTNPVLSEDLDTNSISGGFTCADPTYCLEL